MQSWSDSLTLESGQKAVVKTNILFSASYTVQLLVEGLEIDLLFSEGGFKENSPLSDSVIYIETVSLEPNNVGRSVCVGMIARNNVNIVASLVVEEGVASLEGSQLTLV
jgi:hypothetical protein